jgi:hypothetical protein
MLAGLFGWAVYDPEGLRHKTVGYSEHEINNSSLELQTAIAKSSHDLDVQLWEAQTRLVELRRGPRRCQCIPLVSYLSTDQKAASVAMRTA